MADKYAEKAKNSGRRRLSVRRMHFNRDSTPKRAYSSRAAVAVAKRLGANAYCCPICGSHHVGSSDG